MKRKMVAAASAVIAGLMFGYLFILSLLIGFLASKFVAAKSTGEQGRFNSIIIPFRRWGIHLHHWLYSLWLLGFSYLTGSNAGK